MGGTELVIDSLLARARLDRALVLRLLGEEEL